MWLTEALEEANDINLAVACVTTWRMTCGAKIPTLFQAAQGRRTYFQNVSSLARGELDIHLDSICWIAFTN